LHSRTFFKSKIVLVLSNGIIGPLLYIYSYH
jgi:hypothetical protein